jgi:hypothetical protein
LSEGKLFRLLGAAEVGGKELGHFWDVQRLGRDIMSLRSSPRRRSAVTRRRASLNPDEDLASLAALSLVADAAERQRGRDGVLGGLRDGDGDHGSATAKRTNPSLRPTDGPLRASSSSMVSRRRNGRPRPPAGRRDGFQLEARLLWRLRPQL